jgi:branched-chain amino acid transport system ATP-binding protein
MADGLEITDLHVRYGRAQAVSGVSLVAPRGSVTALLGPNGAGKSSTILATYGTVRASGSVRLDGVEMSHLGAARRARGGLAIVPQGRQLFARLSVHENLMVAAEHLRLPRRVVDEAEQRFPILADRRRKLAGVLSGGEQQMLVVARALMGAPKALLLDELVTGLAPKIVQDLAATVRSLADEGLAVLLAAPELVGLRGIVDGGYVMIRGELVTECLDPASLQAAYEARLSSIAKV